MLALIAVSLPLAGAPKKTEGAPPAGIPAGVMLWAEPDDIAARDLFYGALRAKKTRLAEPLTFEEGRP